MKDDAGKFLADKLKQANPNNVPMAVGIGWYRPETYAKCLAIFEDRADLPATYSEWLMLAERTEKQVTQQGLTVVRVDIDPDTFPAWCKANGFTRIGKEARMAYGNLKAAESIPGIT